MLLGIKQGEVVKSVAQEEVSKGIAVMCALGNR